MAAEIQAGDRVKRRTVEREPEDQTAYTVKAIGEDGGRKFACLVHPSDPSLGVFGSYYLEDLKLVPAKKAAPEKKEPEKVDEKKAA